MKTNRLAIEAVVVGGLWLISVVLGLQRVTGQAFVPVNNSAPDTATIERLTRGYDGASPSIVQRTTDVTGTNATLLAAGLLLGQPYFVVSLPMIQK